MKPEKFLIKDGAAKLNDLSSIKNNIAPLITVTDKTKFFETWKYLAPEILKRQQFNEKCHVWATKVIFYQMLTNGLDIFRGRKGIFSQRKNILAPEMVIDSKATKYEEIIFFFSCEENWN